MKGGWLPTAGAGAGGGGGWRKELVGWMGVSFGSTSEESEAMVGP